jgi:hypothetical protein
MPAKSEKQRRYLNVHFGHKWVKAHGFDNKGKLPEYVGGSKAKKAKAAKKKVTKKRTTKHRGKTRRSK